MSTRLGTLTLDLVAKIGNFLPPMEKSQKKLKDFGKEATKMAKVAGAAFASLAAAGGAMFVKLTKDGLAAVDAQAKVARSLDTTFDSITALGMAFGNAGIDNFEASLNRLNRRLGAAELGRGAALKAVQELNLNLQELSQVPADERLAVIADRIREVSTNSQTAARYAQDLGFEQREAAQFFLQGGDAIRAYSEQVDKLGLSLTEIETAQIEAANDALGIFGDIVQSITQRLAVEAAPLLQAFATSIEDAVIEAGGLGNVASEAFDSMITGVAFVIDAFDGLTRVFKITANLLVQDIASGLSKVIGLAGSVLDDLNSIPTWINPIGLLIPDETVENLQAAAALQKSISEQAGEEIDFLLTDPLAGQKFKAEADKIRKSAEDLAADVIKTREKINSPGSPSSPIGAADFGATVIFSQDEVATVDLIAERYEELQKIAIRTSESLRTPQEIFQQEIELLNELRETRKANSDEMLISQQDYLRGVEAAQERLAQSTKETEDEMSQFSVQAARNMQDSFADFLFDPFEKGLDGLLQSFVKTLQRMAAEAAAAKIFGGIGGLLGGSGGIIGSFFGSIFGGARAMGGPVRSDKAYLVGERGPELFTPTSNGYITKNSDLVQSADRGQEPPNVVLNIHNAPEGTRVEQRQLDRDFIIDVMLEDGASGGKYSEFGQRRFGWKRQGS